MSLEIGDFLADCMEIIGRKKEGKGKENGEKNEDKGVRRERKRKEKGRIREGKGIYLKQQSGSRPAVLGAPPEPR